MNPPIKNTADKLGFLRSNHPAAYNNLLRVLDDAYAAYLCETAEKAFLAGKTHSYTCYGVLVDHEDEFANALSMQHFETALYYLYVRKDYRYAVVYAVNPENRIETRRHLFFEKLIKEALTAFKHCLAPCSPGDVVCEIDPTTNQTIILKDVLTMLFNFNKFFNDRTNRDIFSDNDACRMAAYFIQNGKCYVTGAPLLQNERELHHRLPRQYGGQDTPTNLVLLTKRVHRMVHTEDFDEFYSLLSKEPMTDVQLNLLNQLRLEAHREPIGGDSYVRH